MNTRAIATAIMKLLGIYIFLQYLTVLPMAISAIKAYMDVLMGINTEPAMSRMSVFAPMGFYILLMSALYLGSSALLMFRARNLARFFTADVPEEPSLAGAGTDSAITLGFQCLGLYAIVTWAPQFIQTLWRTLMYNSWQDTQTPFSYRFYENWSTLIGPVIGTLLGLLLLFKARGLLRLVKLSRPSEVEKK